MVLDPAALQPLSLEGRIRVTEVLGCREPAEVTLELTFLTTVVTDSGTGGTKYLTFLLTLRWALQLPLRQGGTGKIAVSQEHTWGKRKTQEVTQSLQRRQVASSLLDSSWESQLRARSPSLRLRVLTLPAIPARHVFHRYFPPHHKDHYSLTHKLSCQLT